MVLRMWGDAPDAKDRAKLLHAGKRLVQTHWTGWSKSVGQVGIIKRHVPKTQAAYQLNKPTELALSKL